MNPKRRSLFYLAGFFVAMGAAGVIGRLHTMNQRAIASPPDSPVLVAAAERSNQSSEVLLPGDTHAMTETSLYARVDGYVLRRYAEIGDHVRAGQTLLVIQSPEVEGRLAESRANLDRIKAEMELARVTSERWQRLASQNAVSLQERDQKQADYEARRAQMAAESANLQRLSEMHSYQTIVAPFAGVITERDLDLETGNLVSSGSGRSTRPLFRIANTDELKVLIHVPQSYAESVHEGDRVDLQVQEKPGRPFSGVVSHRTGALDSSSRTMLTEIKVLNRDHSILPGYFVQVKLRLTTRDRPLSVPASALIFGAEGVRVAKLDAGNHVHFQKVEPGRDFGSSTEIISGLSEGDRVILNPSTDLEEGATPRIQNEKK